MGGAVLEPMVSGPLERLGVAGILVVAAYFFIRYFMSELAKKDTRIVDITDRFIAAMKDMADKNEKQAQLVTRAIADNTAAMNELRDVVRSASSPVSGPRATDTVGVRRHQ